MVGYYFERTGASTFTPTINAEGAWSKEDYHFASLAGLVVHESELKRPDNGLVLSRISYDILGRLPFTEVDVQVEVIRPGLTIQLVETTVTAKERQIIKARLWYLSTSDTRDVASVKADRLPPPDGLPSRDFSEDWDGGLCAQMVMRQVIQRQPGRGATWVTSPNRLVKDEDPIQIAEFLSRIDVANGINPQQPPERWAFPNVDLTVHLYRQPEGDWTGLDTTVHWGENGIGLTSSDIHDINGPVGRAEQSLTLRWN